MLTGCSKGLFEVLLRHLPEAATGVEVVARNKVRGESGSAKHTLEAQRGLGHPISTCGRPGPIPHYVPESPIGTRQRGHGDAKGSSATSSHGPTGL